MNTVSSPSACSARPFCWKNRKRKTYLGSQTFVNGVWLPKQKTFFLSLFRPAIPAFSSSARPSPFTPQKVATLRPRASGPGFAAAGTFRAARCRCRVMARSSLRSFLRHRGRSPGPPQKRPFSTLSAKALQPPHPPVRLHSNGPRFFFSAEAKRKIVPGTGTLPVWGDRGGEAPPGRRRHSRPPEAFPAHRRAALAEATSFATSATRCWCSGCSRL